MQFIQSLVSCPAGLSDIHKEIFACRPDAVDTGLVRDLIEGVFIGAEGDPRGPGEGAPVIEEVSDIFGVKGVVGIGRHLLYRI